MKCADNSLYCGVSTDTAARVAKHNAGKGAKYTRSRLPVELIAVSHDLSKSDAFKLEHYIKKQPADKKVEALKNAETEEKKKLLECVINKIEKMEM